MHGTGDEFTYEYAYTQALCLDTAGGGRHRRRPGRGRLVAPRDEIVAIDHAIAAFYATAARETVLSSEALREGYFGPACALPIRQT